MFLSTIGSILSDWLDASLKPLTKRFGEGALISKVIGAISASLFALIFFIFIPAAIFSVVERSNDWTYLISVYYCFVTLTTVGFGDFVPGIAGASISGDFATVGLYKILTTAWLWIGLAILAAIISEIQGVIEAGGKAFHKWQRTRKKKALKYFVEGGSNQELTNLPSGDDSGPISETPHEGGETVEVEGGSKQDLTNLPSGDTGLISETPHEGGETVEVEGGSKQDLTNLLSREDSNQSSETPPRGGASDDPNAPEAQEPSEQTAVSDGISGD